MIVIPTITSLAVLPVVLCAICKRQLPQRDAFEVHIVEDVGYTAAGSRLLRPTGEITYECPSCFLAGLDEEDDDDGGDAA